MAELGLVGTHSGLTAFVIPRPSPYPNGQVNLVTVGRNVNLVEDMSTRWDPYTYNFGRRTLAGKGRCLPGKDEHPCEPGITGPRELLLRKAGSRAARAFARDVPSAGRHFASCSR
jgi:hypothetical protein